MTDKSNAERAMQNSKRPPKRRQVSGSLGQKLGHHQHGTTAYTCEHDGERMAKFYKMLLAAEDQERALNFKQVAFYYEKVISSIVKLTVTFHWHPLVDPRV